MLLLLVPSTRLWRNRHAYQVYLHVHALAPVVSVRRGDVEPHLGHHLRQRGFGVGNGSSGGVSSKQHQKATMYQQKRKFTAHYAAL
jgi:hypothetical protein